MDANRFASLLRHLGSSSSRRVALRFLIASAIGAWFAPLFGPDTDVSQARRQPPNQHAHGGHHDRVQAGRKKKKKKKQQSGPPVSPPASPPPPPPPPPSP